MPQDNSGNFACPPESTANKGTKETIGEYLRRIRCGRNISLDEAAAATKINPANLKAIEEENQAELPAQVFVRGFIKLYADYLGLDAQEILTRCTTFTENDTRTGVKTVSGPPIFIKNANDQRYPFRFGLLIAFFIMLLAACLGYFLIRTPRHTVPPHSPPPPAEVTEKFSVPAPLAENTVETKKEVKDEKPSPPPEHNTATALLPIKDNDSAAVREFAYTLDARFIERTWLRISTDEGPAKEYLFRPGEHRIWQAMKKIDLFLGNAAGVKLTLNGKPLPTAGKSGQTIQIPIPGPP